jgi:hypothetical protein
MKRRLKEQTRLDSEGVALASFIHTNFSALRKNFIDLEPKQTLGRVVQAYIDANKIRIADNYLTGIIAISDVWRHATGGRIHLVAGMLGPIVESLHPPAVKQPIDYEVKSRLLLKAIAQASGLAPPFAGKIHVHLWHATKTRVQMSDLLEFLRREHGFQNDLQQLADVKPYFFMGLSGQPYWRPANNEIVNRALQRPVLAAT